MIQSTAKLTIEHLAKHLPFGVKVPSSLSYNYGGVSTDAEYLTINGIRDNYVSFENMAGFYPINDFKITLFPLSSLTKQDLLDIIKLSGHTLSHLNGEGFEIALERFKKDAISGRLPYMYMKELFIRHFDVDRLIEQGLAVDASINNPYE